MPAEDLEHAIIRRGVQWWGEEGDTADGGLSMILLRATDVAHLSDEDLCAMLGLDEYHGGPGCTYRNRPGVERGKHVVLVSQRFGLDI